MEVTLGGRGVSGAEVIPLMVPSSTALMEAFLVLEGKVDRNVVFSQAASEGRWKMTLTLPEVKEDNAYVSQIH